MLCVEDLPPMANVGFTRNLGMILLAVWLILFGLSGVVTFPLPPIVMSVLAILAGILILLRR